LGPAQRPNERQQTLDIYAIIKIAQSSAAPLKKAIWIVVILLLPVLGLILWWLLGPKSS
jgi:hypothetical protein